MPELQLVFLERTIKNADLVTVNGHYLLDYVRSFNKNAAIINGPVDCDSFSLMQRHNPDKIIIGWDGNPHHHCNDLALLIKPL
jgi:hypothetical protein